MRFNRSPPVDKRWWKWGPKWQIYGKLWKSQKWSRIIPYDSREVQEAFMTTRAPLKRSQSEDLTTSKKHSPRSHMNPQNHPKIHKSLVLAHNIHKDCPLGVARGFSHDIWSEALSFTIGSEGPERENQGFNATCLPNQHNMLRSSNLKIPKPN